MNRRVAVLALVALVALTGCSTLEPGDSGDQAEFAESVEFDAAGVAGEPVQAQVQAENTGDSTTEYVATLKVDGENATTKSVSLDPGERTTVTLATPIDDAGEYDLTVAGEERTIAIYESPMELFSALEGDSSGTRIAERKAMVNAVVEVEGEAYNFTLESTATERANYTAETQYTITNTTLTVLGETFEETTEGWVVNGTLYEKTTDQQSGEVEYLREPSDEYEDETNISNEEIQQFLTMEHRDDEFVVILSANSSSEAAQLWSAFGTEDEEATAGTLQSVAMEFHVDRRTGRPTGVEMNLSVGNVEGYNTFDMSIQEKFVAFDEPVDVSVPDEVRENAEPEDPTGR